jgi:hypothetical protein
MHFFGAWKEKMLRGQEVITYSGTYASADGHHAPKSLPACPLLGEEKTTAKSHM